MQTGQPKVLELLAVDELDSSMSNFITEVDFEGVDFGVVLQTLQTSICEGFAQVIGIKLLNILLVLQKANDRELLNFVALGDVQRL